jgi:hypothetical protein
MTQRSADALQRVADRFLLPHVPGLILSIFIGLTR